jgi:hypothetical protein
MEKGIGSSIITFGRKKYFEEENLGVNSQQRVDPA